MKIAIDYDHAGYSLKKVLIDELKSNGCQIEDLAPHEPDPSDDYPDVAQRACKAVLSGRCERAVLVCGSGIGVSIAANKFPGIRAGCCHDIYSAHQGVEHDDMNVICLGARIIGEELAREIVRAFANACFKHEDRFVRRLDKVKDIEHRFMREK